MKNIKKFNNFINESNNELTNDSERIDELKSCLEKAYYILQNEKDIETSCNKSRTLIRDVLSRYEEGKKFITANVNKEGPFEFIDENIDNTKCFTENDLRRAFEAGAEVYYDDNDGRAEMRTSEGSLVDRSFKVFLTILNNKD